MNIHPRDRVRGTLLGLAAGDRIGGPIRMALCIAESLAERGAYEREDVLARYLAWWRAGGFDTGPVAASAFDLMAAGVPAPQAVARAHALCGGMTAGCNPAHRSPPLAMAAFLAGERLPDIARLDASLTHEDPLAGDVAGAGVVLCRYLIEGADWPAAVRLATAGRDQRTREALLAGPDAPLKDSGFAPEVLRAAVRFVSAHARFDAALEAAVAFAGAANYCPVLAGALAGARWGAASIPAHLLGHCGVLPRVRSAAEVLAGAW